MRQQKKPERRDIKMKVIIVISAITLVLVAAVMIFMLVKNTKTPAGLGVNNGKLAPMPASPNAVSSQTEDMERKRLIPFPSRKV